MIKTKLEIKNNDAGCRQKKTSLGYAKAVKKTKRNDVTNVAMKNDAKRQSGAKRRSLNL